MSKRGSYVTLLRIVGLRYQERSGGGGGGIGGGVDRRARLAGNRYGPRPVRRRRRRRGSGDDDDAEKSRARGFYTGVTRVQGTYANAVRRRDARRRAAPQTFGVVTTRRFLRVRDAPTRYTVAILFGTRARAAAAAAAAVRLCTAGTDAARACTHTGSNVPPARGYRRAGSVARRAGAMDRADRLARSLELEKAYVHDTYQEMYHPAHKTKPWPKVTRFLHDLEPGSLVCDIGEPTDFHPVTRA